MYEPEWLQKATKLVLPKHAKDLPGRWCQLKLDGIGSQAVFNCNDIPEIYAMSKAAKSGEFTNFSEKIPHIQYELAGLDFTGILQGEILATHLPTCHENFGFTTGTLHADDAVERQGEDCRLKFVIYDMPSHPGPYKERYAAISDLLKGLNLKYVSLNPILDINYENSWEKVFDEVVSAGGEGIILYDANALYKHAKPGQKNQRNRGVIKVKAENECEVICIEMIEGDGKYTGTLGAMTCVDGDGRQFNVGSFAISDEERKQIWDTMTVPGIVEITYYQQTPDSYKLPRLTRIRPDKDIDSWNKHGE